MSIFICHIILKIIYIILSLIFKIFLSTRQPMMLKLLKLFVFKQDFPLLFHQVPISRESFTLHKILLPFQKLTSEGFLKVGRGGSKEETEKLEAIEGKMKEIWRIRGGEIEKGIGRARANFIYLLW